MIKAVDLKNAILQISLLCFCSVRYELNPQRQHQIEKSGSEYVEKCLTVNCGKILVMQNIFGIVYKKQNIVAIR